MNSIGKMGKYILALDQGTTSSRAILFDKDQNVCGMAQKEYPQIYPKEGWVEHDPMEIYSSQHRVMTGLLHKYSVDPKDISAIGITNQRETTIVWDKATGRPVHNAIVWQCRRTLDIVDSLVKAGLGDHIKKTTGLVPDAYFSGTKIKWILDNVPGAREKAKKGEFLFGTVDTWLIWKLTDGEVHATDYTNASRTMIFDIHKLDWDEKLLSALDIPREMLPKVYPSSHVFGNAAVSGKKIPITGVAGDQQAALFGQCCFEKGELKNTYGTGCFLLMNTGNATVESSNGLLATIAAGSNEKLQYALEGSVFTGGAVIQWLRDEMHFFTDSRDAEYLAGKVRDSGGIYFVPAFTGLGAPWWDMRARGSITGITRGTKKEHIIRAAEEAIAYQSLDLITAMEKDAGLELKELKVDGGASRDKLLMQFQADISGRTLLLPETPETTALGAAFLAGLETGFWKDKDEIRSKWKCDTVFKPQMEKERQEKLVGGWHKAVSRCVG